MIVFKCCLKHRLILFIFLMLLGGTKESFTQEVKKTKKNELSFGYGLLLYQSVYSMDNSSGVELAYSRIITDQIRWETGLRLGINPFRPEGFGRILFSNSFGKWVPSIGLEMGLTNRAFMESSSDLLRETKEAMTTEMGYVYLSSHAELLAFQFENQYTLSLLELDFGTHFRHFGRTMRLQLNLFSVGRKF